MRRLPSLSGVEAFVAVARAGSVKAAAEGLSLSSPALSRRLQSLERFVGKPLFERRHHALALNADGERLLALIAPALDQMSDAIETVGGVGRIMRLRLGVLPLFASQQLIPRLPALRAAHPSLHLDIDTAAHGIARLGEGIDAAIVIASESPSISGPSSAWDRQSPDRRATGAWGIAPPCPSSRRTTTRPRSRADRR